MMLASAEYKPSWEHMCYLYNRYRDCMKRMTEVAEAYVADVTPNAEGRRIVSFEEVQAVQWPYSQAMKHCFDDAPFERFCFNEYIFPQPLVQLDLLPLDSIPEWAQQILKKGDTW